ncbi:uncharacterized protein F4822DRAFT_430918 [Hypoxylon trugodes]|uniref:uncharacterized protein n=1 Tax=Hypoxylon trugodes TaxID=326681 RepID=UPI00219DF187|nr:uncharacterized protein F4822DRAFT_430918 [Hypoxylon trugodes]KAI1386041.1 hypothetical protein F4822DRAFT_430918 [Hypoxylon trugodes]
MGDPLSVTASVIAVVDASIKVASLCSKYYKDVKNAQKDIDRLKSEITNLKDVSKSVQKLLDGPNGAKLEASQSLHSALKEILSQLETLETKLRPTKHRKAMRKFGWRALKWPFEGEDVDKAVQDLRRHAQTVSLALQVDQTTAILDHDQKTVLNRLPIADGAAFDSHAEEYNPTCYEGTRVDLLREISEWAGGPKAKAVFWLNGMAGTGKSTISRTVAQNFSKKNQLGASFFFKKGEGDRGGATKLFTTIAAQLIQREPALAPPIQRAINDDPGIFGKRMRDQFEKLVWDPWSQITRETPNTSTLLIVVDALDECEREEDIRTIISLFSRPQPSQSSQLRILVTSRPELPIRLGFNDAKGTFQDLILHEIPEQVVGKDISVFLTHELENIRNDYNKSVSNSLQLSPIWPGQPNIQVLVKMAVPLFIFAATVCRFIKDTAWRDPDGQLKKVLAYETNTNNSELDKLDATYRPILEQVLAGQNEHARKSLIGEFCRVVGAIVLLAQPLSTLSLEKLLATSPGIVDRRLSSLHSVLNISSNLDIPIRLFHKSFRDYLLDVERRDSNPFWVNEKETNKQLAINCIRIMNDALRTNICDIQWPGTPRSSTDSRIISDKLRPEIRYACQYWVYHIKQAGGNGNDDNQIYSFLQQHFLHWLEALSLMGRVSESLQMIRTLQSLPEVRYRRAKYYNIANLIWMEVSTQLRNFLTDATRFILTNISIIQHAPLQTYCSVLAFAPEKSIVRTTFKNNIPKWVCLQPRVEAHWNACLQILEGHSSLVRSVAFSADSKLVASGSYDKTVRLWSTDTGELQQTLKGHSSRVSSVAFSADSKLVASGSYNKTVWLWSTDTGKLQQTLKGHSNWVTSVIFSADSKLVASGSGDKTVRLWSTDTGKLQQTLEGHSSWVSSVAFSADSKLVASGSGDKTVRLWSTDTGDCLLAHDLGTTFYNLSFDPNGKTLHTNTGAISLNDLHSLTRIVTINNTDHSLISPRQIPKPGRNYLSGYGISTTNEWITLDGNNLFWLPADSRPRKSAVSGSTIVIGCPSGKVIIMCFLAKGPLEISLNASV